MSHTTVLAAAMMIVGPFLLIGAQAQEGTGPVRRNRVRPLPALRFESVQKELALTDDQKAKSDALLQEFGAAATRLFDETFNGRELGALSDKEQDKWFDLIRKLNDDFEPKLKAILKPEQLERAQQIAYQIQGPANLLNPDIIKALALTEDQLAKITTLNRDLNVQNAKIIAERTDAGPGEKLVKLRGETMERLSEVLTKDQADKWSALKGKPFSLSPPRRDTEKKE